MTGLFAGGGVQGGRVIGRTDELGAKVSESGWNVKRSVEPFASKQMIRNQEISPLFA
jgi:hypothetical protein